MTETGPEILIKWAVIGALSLGGLGFVCGFVLPVLLTPEANQGLLLGIFIAGPLGFVVGGVCCALSSRRLQARFGSRKE